MAWSTPWFFKPGGVTPSGVTTPSGVAEQISWGRGRPLAVKKNCLFSIGVRFYGM